MQAVTEQKKDDSGITIVDVTGTADAKTLPFTKSFTVDWINHETGDRLVGTFTATRPPLGTIGLIAVMKARLNGGERVHPDIDFMHEMVAFLHYVLTDTPDWWKPHEFFDATILRKVWDHVRSWQDSFRKRVEQ